MNRKTPTRLDGQANGFPTHRFAWLVLVAVLVNLYMFAPGFAQDETTPRQVTDNEVNAVAKELYCPVCENIPLDVCPTQACHEWRELIRDKLAQGWTKEQVKQYFADQYGDRVLGAPPARGLNWLAYTIPPVVIMLGIYILYRSFKSWRNSTLSVATTPLTSSPDAESNSGEQNEYIHRLEEELRKQ